MLVYSIIGQLLREDINFVKAICTSKLSNENFMSIPFFNLHVIIMLESFKSVIRNKISKLFITQLATLFYETDSIQLLHIFFWVEIPEYRKETFNLSLTKEMVSVLDTYNIFLFASELLNCCESRKTTTFICRTNHFFTSHSRIKDQHLSQRLHRLYLPVKYSFQ